MARQLDPSAKSPNSGSPVPVERSRGRWLDRVEVVAALALLMAFVFGGGHQVLEGRDED